MQKPFDPIDLVRKIREVLTNDPAGGPSKTGAA